MTDKDTNSDIYEVEDVEGIVAGIDPALLGGRDPSDIEVAVLETEARAAKDWGRAMRLPLREYVEKNSVCSTRAEISEIVEKVLSGGEARMCGGTGVVFLIRDAESLDADIAPSAAPGA